MDTKENMFRCVCYTLWNYTDADIEHLKNYKNAYFHVAAEEEGTDTQKPHIQGYIELKDRKRFKLLVEQLTAKNTLCKGIHLEKREGTQQEAIDYILDPPAHLNKKRGRPLFVVGIPRRANEVTWEEYVRKLVLEYGISSVGELCTSGLVELDKQLLSSYEKVEEYLGKPVRYPVSLTWIYSSPLTPIGIRTDFVQRYLSSFSSYYRINPIEGYFQGYVGQKTILWDNFHHWCPSDVYDPMLMSADLKLKQREILRFLMYLTDPVTSRYNKKWGSVAVKPEHVVVISTMPPWYIFSHGIDNEKRRFDTVPAKEDLYKNPYLSELMVRLTYLYFINEPDGDLPVLQLMQGPSSPRRGQDELLARSSDTPDNAPPVVGPVEPVNPYKFEMSTRRLKQ